LKYANGEESEQSLRAIKGRCAYVRGTLPKNLSCRRRSGEEKGMLVSESRRGRIWQTVEVDFMSVVDHAVLQAAGATGLVHNRCLPEASPDVSDVQRRPLPATSKRRDNTSVGRDVEEHDLVYIGPRAVREDEKGGYG